MKIRGFRVSLIRPLCILLLLISPFSLPALDWRLDASPGLLVPVTDHDVWGLGGGGRFTLDAEFFDFLLPYLGADVNWVSPATAQLDGSLLLLSAGVGAGFYLYPADRLRLAFSGGTGVYLGSWSSDAAADPVMTGNIFWKAGLDAGYRLSPGLTLSGNLFYTDYLTQSDSLYRGISIGISANMAIGGKGAEGRALLDTADTESVFPIIAPDYKTTPFGSLTIRNAESAEIRDVEILFEAEGYTAGPLLCGGTDFLGKGGTVTVPLYADFSEEILTVTEKTRVTGQVTIRYRLLGEPRSAEAETTVSLLHRNALTWQDPRILASFVSPNDPAVLDFSKYIAGLIRTRARTELDPHLQYALGLFEAFRLNEIAWGRDPQTPYEEMRRNPGETDYVQYPYQTIAYRSGDSDDLAVLYAASLESIGVPAAVIPLEGEVLAAFRMKLDAGDARAMFGGAGGFIYRDGAAWAPVKVALLREGFLRAWSAGSEAWERAGDEELFLPMSEAWNSYPAVGIPDVTARGRKPAADEVGRVFDTLISLVVTREVTPKAERMLSSFGPDGGSGRKRNSLGVLYARYGLYRQALEQFKAAVDKGYGRAAINVGNIAFLMEDYETAIAWYRQTMEKMPRNSAPVIGMARALYELDRFDEADVYFQKAAEMSPRLAERYSYLAARLAGNAVRASAAAERLGDMIWVEE